MWGRDCNSEIISKGCIGLWGGNLRMKVLKTGKDNPNLWKKEYTCTGYGWEQHGSIPCGALLEVSITDIRRRFHTDMGGCTDEYYGFTCPKCQCFTEIPHEDVPSNLRGMIRDY